jgi:V/A-type H+-transporting ATPase subunit D
LQVAPTKTSALELKRNLAFATEGYELLEQKREILVMELMSRLEKTRSIQAETDKLMADAYESLKKAAMHSGSAKLSAEALSAARPTAQLAHGHVMGIDIPKIDAELPETGPRFAPGTGSSASDEVLMKFRAALEKVTLLAELENAVIRLARELKKTQRRVNALEKLFIPDYKDTLKYIYEVLEERERDEMVIMKITKERAATVQG